MMRGSVKEKLAKGKQVLGTFLDLGCAEAAECMGLAGLDYFIVDTEHSPYDLPQVTECCRAAQLRGIAPFVRIKEISRGSVMKALDAGAEGLIVPGVTSVEEVQELVRWGKYIPMGERGFCPTRCCAWGYDDSMKDGIRAYTDQCNAQTMLIPQCETLGCLEHLEEILALDGVDGIFVGPFDLSVAFQKPGMFHDVELIEAFERIRLTCAKAGKPVFIFAPDLKTAALRFEQGFDGVCYSSDLNVMTDALRLAVETLNGKEEKSV